MPEPEKSLYHRLGGYDAVAAFVDELLLRLTADPHIGVYWKGKSKDSMKRQRQLVVDFLCAGSGGPVNTRLNRPRCTSWAGGSSNRIVPGGTSAPLLMSSSTEPFPEM